MEHIVARHVLSTVLVLAFLALPSSVEAQGGRFPNAFLDINGVYPLSSPAEVSATLSDVSLYDESPEYRIGYRPARKVFPDARAGVRVWNGLALGVAVSLDEPENDVTVSGSIPNPLFYGRPRTASPLSVSLKERLLGVHLQAVYFVPSTNAFQVSFFAGPSFFRLSRTSVEGVTLGPELDAPLFESVAVSDVNTTSNRATAIGASAGIDITVMLSRVFGVGIFAKYVTGSVSVGTQSVDVGGAQAGGGFRFRF